MSKFLEEKRLARTILGSLPRRWAHVKAAGVAAEGLVRSHSMPAAVARATWLHDIGYGPSVSVTGFHALDGAQFLARVGFEMPIVGLVAYHTGAQFEAEQRGLLVNLMEIPEPDNELLDLLTMIDVSISPNGQTVRDIDRVDEILNRYEPGHPVHDAVTRSAPYLLNSSARGKKLLGLPDDWPIVS